MKKIIAFDKNLEFPSMIGEITSISLDHQLHFKDESNIIGKFIINGSYKRTEASILEEDFHFEIPVEILLNEKINIEKSKIEIDDFSYKIENDDTISCNISLLVEGMEIIDISEDEEKEETRECDGDSAVLEHLEISDDNNIDVLNQPTNNQNINNEIPEAVIKEESDISKETITEKEEETNKMIKDDDIAEDVGSLFTSLKDSEETFSTYSVYIVRTEETLDTIISKFKITKEELEAYNDLSNIGVGSKLIIPLNNESD